MTEESVCVIVDVAKNSLYVAVSNLIVTKQFKNDREGINRAVRYIAGLRPVKVTFESTGKFETPSAVSRPSRMSAK